MYSHILIATDGSELAAKGVNQGLDLASKLGASVTVLSVTGPIRPQVAEAAMSGGIADPLLRYEQQMDDQVAKLGDVIETKAKELNVRLEIIRETDDFPADAIIRTAKVRHCDLIVMTSHGRSGLKKLLLGSQTSEVLKHTTLPVLVVR